MHLQSSWGGRRRCGAPAAAPRLRGLTCRQCGQQYAYSVSRDGGGLLSLGANRDLAVSRDMEFLRQPGRKIDLVPCPQCHALSPEMLAEGRRRSLRRVLCFAPVALALLGAGIHLLAVGRSRSAAAALGAAAVILLGWLKVSYDARRQALPSLTPAPDADPSRHAGVWTRQNLEELAAANPRIDLADALLDWERQGTAPQ
ncbi:MAG: hypothetical protein NTV86_04315 [Planctomycetota bacterium]|nr:hypothetical protein [Planctomycetota bacterium]